MSLYVQLKNRLKQGLAALFGCIFCMQSYAADDRDRVGDFDQHSGDDGDTAKLMILPIHMMDDETLFKAAAAERDTSMSLAQRMFNNHWLLHGDKTQSGGRILQRYVHDLVINYFKRNRQPSHAKVEVSLQKAYRKEELPITDLSHYRLRVSDDNIRLQFRYRFD